MKTIIQGEYLIPRNEDLQNRITVLRKSPFLVNYKTLFPRERTGRIRFLPVLERALFRTCAACDGIGLVLGVHSIATVPVSSEVRFR
jgi:hypothetical protein